MNTITKAVYETRAANPCSGLGGWMSNIGGGGCIHPIPRDLQPYMRRCLFVHDFEDVLYTRRNVRPLYLTRAHVTLTRVLLRVDNHFSVISKHQDVSTIQKQLYMYSY